MATREKMYQSAEDREEDQEDSSYLLSILSGVVLNGKKTEEQ